MTPKIWTILIKHWPSSGGAEPAGVNWGMLGNAIGKQPPKQDGKIQVCDWPLCKSCTNLVLLEEVSEK